MIINTGLGWDVIISAGVIATGTLLARAGISHLWNPLSLAESLSTGHPQHRGLMAAVRFWGLLETALGIGLVIVLFRPGPPIVALSVTAVVVLVGYTIWLIRRIRSPQPWCACTTGPTPINLATVLRPLTMALPVAALSISATIGHPMLDGAAVVEMVGAVLAGIGLGLIGWSYPEAIRGCAGRTLLDRTRTLAIDETTVSLRESRTGLLDRGDYRSPQSAHPLTTITGRTHPGVTS